VTQKCCAAMHHQEAMHTAPAHSLPPYTTLHLRHYHPGYPCHIPLPSHACNQFANCCNRCAAHVLLYATNHFGYCRVWCSPTCTVLTNGALHCVSTAVQSVALLHMPDDASSDAQLLTQHLSTVMQHVTSGSSNNSSSSSMQGQHARGGEGSSAAAVGPDCLVLAIPTGHLQLANADHSTSTTLQQFETGNTSQTTSSNSTVSCTTAVLSSPGVCRRLLAATQQLLQQTNSKIKAGHGWFMQVRQAQPSLLQHAFKAYKSKVHLPMCMCSAHHSAMVSICQSGCQHVRFIISMVQTVGIHQGSSRMRTM
jgi:hypothetical protein